MFQRLIAAFTEPDSMTILGLLVFFFIIEVVIFLLPDPKKPILEYLHTTGLLIFGFLSFPITLPVIALFYYYEKKVAKKIDAKIDEVRRAGRAEASSAYARGYDEGYNKGYAEACKDRAAGMEN